MDNAITAGKPLADDAKERLASADKSEKEADAWNKESISLATLAGPIPELQNWKNIRPEFKKKLEDLGIDTHETDRHGILKIGESDGVRNALWGRIAELQEKIREAKLDLPHGKEEMVVEAINKFANEADLSTFNLMVAEQIKAGDASMEMAPAEMAHTLQPLFNPMYYKATAYPVVVQKEVVRQLTKRAAMKAGATSIDKVDALANQLFGQIASSAFNEKVGEQLRGTKTPVKEMGDYLKVLLNSGATANENIRSASEQEAAILELTRKAAMKAGIDYEDEINKEKIENLSKELSGYISSK